MKQFLITNLYNMYNAGEIMQLEALRRNFPRDQFTIASVYSIISLKECARLKVGYTGNIKPPPKIRLVIKAISLLLQALLTRLGVVKTKGIVRAYSDSDMIIDLGGDTLSDDVSLIYTLAHCYSLLLAVILDKDYILCSQSIGKFKTIFTRLLAKFVLKRARLIITREAESTRYIKEELGIPGELVRQAIDIAYLSTETTNYKAPNSIGILTASLSKKQTGISAEENLAMLTKLATFYTLAGKEVILIPHINCPVRGIGATANLDDRSVADGIKKLLNTTRIGEASDASRVSLVIGSRMHGCISALADGSPAVALSYSHKFQALNGNARIIDIKEASKDISLVIKAGNEAIEKNRPNILYERASAKESIFLIEDIVDDGSKRLIGKAIGCYFGHSADSVIRDNGASGGVVKSLLMAGIKTGCFKEILSVDANGLLKVTSDADEITQDSVYHSYIPTIAKEQLSKCSGKTGIVSLPCQVKRYRTLFHHSIIIGLFCSHAIELQGVRFLIRTLGLEGNTIKYRYKHNSTTGLMVDGKAFIPQKEYWGEFFNYCFIPRHCLKCRDQTAELADISIGDAHGHPEFGRGKNAIIIRTSAGTRLLQNAVESGLIVVEETNTNSIYRTQRNYINIKKGRLNLKLRAYLALRATGCFLSRYKLFRPLLYLWLNLVVKKEIICQSI